MYVRAYCCAWWFCYRASVIFYFTFFAFLHLYVSSPNLVTLACLHIGVYFIYSYVQIVISKLFMKIAARNSCEPSHINSALII